MQGQTLGRRIQEGRRSAGLSQEALGERLGVSRQAVSKWENSQSYPDIELLPLIASALHTDIDSLLGYQPDRRDITRRFHGAAGYQHDLRKRH